MTKQILVATDSGAFFHDGDLVVLHKGVTTVREGHPLLDSAPGELFQPFVPTYEHEEPEEHAEDGTEGSETEKSGDEPQDPSSDAQDATETVSDDPAADKDADEPETPKDAPVEAVTANPGERRVTRRGRKQA